MVQTVAGLNLFASQSWENSVNLLKLVTFLNQGGIDAAKR